MENPIWPRIVVYCLRSGFWWCWAQPKTSQLLQLPTWKCDLMPNVSLGFLDDHIGEWLVWCMRLCEGVYENRRFVKWKQVFSEYKQVTEQQTPLNTRQRVESSNLEHSGQGSHSKPLNGSGNSVDSFLLLAEHWWRHCWKQQCWIRIDDEGCTRFKASS